MLNVKRRIVLLLLAASLGALEIGVANSSRDDEEQQLFDERARSLVVVVISQANSYHHAKALRMREEIYAQAPQARPTVHVTHLDFPHVGAWIFIPLISSLVRMHQQRATGVLFLQDDTVVDLRRFTEVAAKYDQHVKFVGHALHDREPSIIHHFAFYEDPSRFKYPNQASGVYITLPLLARLEARLRLEPARTDFNIDAAHELALFVWNEGDGTELTHEDAFCTAPPTGPAAECATYPRAFVPCGAAVDVDAVYFAVKTCRKFHADRLRVVRRTWAPHVRNIFYFSDHTDDAIPTVDVGVPNTDVGHCEKTFAILRHIQRNLSRHADEWQRINWIVLVDDDTILSVSHILRLLSCYDPAEGVVLGERYGYGVRSPKGYNYVTGGGGTILSRRLLAQLAARCTCPSASAPDDMYLGFCLRELAAEIVHSPLFHQARPSDYSKGYLKSHEGNTVSFHKHWMVDPVKVYKTWFEQADLSLAASAASSAEHQEL